MDSFCTPWKHKKNYVFFIFSGGIWRDQEHETGQLFTINNLGSYFFLKFKFNHQEFIACINYTVFGITTTLSCQKGPWILLIQPENV